MLSNENNNRQQEVRDLYELKQVVNSNQGYSDKTSDFEDYLKSQNRLMVEDVNFETVSVSVLEETMREYESLKKLVYQELKDGKVRGEEYREAMISIQKTMSYLYSIYETRSHYAIKDPGKWQRLIEVNIAGNKAYTEKEELEMIKHVVERRWQNDETLVEFDGWLRIQAMRRRLENENQ